MSWDQRKVYVSKMVVKEPIKRTTVTDKKSKRQGTLRYHLTVESVKLQVCRIMFLRTLGLNKCFVRYWTDKKRKIPDVKIKVIKTERND